MILLTSGPLTAVVMVEYRDHNAAPSQIEHPIQQACFPPKTQIRGTTGTAGCADAYYKRKVSI